MTGLDALAQRETIGEITITWNQQEAPSAFTAAVTTFETGPEQRRGGVTGVGHGTGTTADEAVANAVSDSADENEGA